MTPSILEVKVSDNTNKGEELSPATDVSQYIAALPASLPAELLCKIIKALEGQTLEDLAFLWLTVRHVSKEFNAEVENILAHKYLAQSRLLGDCGYLCDQNITYHFTHKDFLELPLSSLPHANETPEAEGCLDDIPFVFSHFDEMNPHIAVYTIAKEEQHSFRESLHSLGNRPEDDFVDTLKQLPQKGHISRWREEKQQKQETFFIGEAKAGGALPGDRVLTKDTDDLEISGDWRELLTKYFQAQTRGLDFKKL